MRRFPMLACVLCSACGASDGGPASSASTAPTTAPPASVAVAATASVSASAAAVDPAVSARGIRWGLGCTPAKLTMGTRGKLEIVVTAKNESKDTLDTQRHRISVTSDSGGHPGRFFGNGHHDKKWSALPPGESVSETWSIGESMLPKAGQTIITVAHEGAKATCTVQVDP